MYDFEQFDSYDLLGVGRTVSAEELKRAYRQEIAQYHPDKWSNAAPAEQEYARKRASAITEAYSKLKKGGLQPAATATPHTADRAERMAQLYNRGRTLLANGKASEAAALLRQLQQADPFYRDSADLLHRAEAATRQTAPAPRRKLAKGWLLGIGSLVGIGALAGAIWLLGGSKISQADQATAPVAARVQTELPRGTPNENVVEKTLVPSSPPAVDPPVPATKVDVASPTPAPEPPTATIAVPTVAVVPPTEVVLPDDLTGAIIVSDNMDGGTWPTSNGGTWTFDYVNGRYRMTMVTGVGSVWAYGAALPNDSVVLAADVEATSGAAGLLFGFVDASNYCRFILAADGTWAFQQRVAGQLRLLLAGEGLAAGRLIVAQRGPISHLYWNDTYLGEAVLPAFPAGSYGFTLAGPSAAEGYFDNLRIRQLP